MKGHEKILGFLTNVESAEKTSNYQYSQRDKRRYCIQSHSEHHQNAIKIGCSEITELLEIKNVTEMKNSGEKSEDKAEGNLSECQVKRQRHRKQKRIGNQRIKPGDPTSE